MSDPVERVMKLIALAGSSVEAESRTAAWLACKLIRENNLVVATKVAKWTYEPPRPREPPPPRYDPPPPPRRTSPSKDSKRVIMSARFGGICSVCRKTIKVGEEIEWIKGVSTKHMRCVEG